MQFLTRTNDIPNALRRASFISFTSVLLPWYKIIEFHHSDGKGSDYFYSYDEFGSLPQEKNRLDGIQNYTYNDNGELKAKKDFEGSMTAVSYDTKTRTKRTQYADGNRTIKTTAWGTVKYSYDAENRLVESGD